MSTELKTIRKEAGIEAQFSARSWHECYISWMSMYRVDPDCHAYLANAATNQEYARETYNCSWYWLSRLLDVPQHEENPYG